MNNYRGRIAPTPTGYLHLGHAQTFWTAAKRANYFKGTLVYRSEDLDNQRCKDEFHDAAMYDLRWLGLNWSEGPDVNGPHKPYIQSERINRYREVFELMRSRGFAYPCNCSRKDVAEASSAPHKNNDEPIYPGTCRPDKLKEQQITQTASSQINWRFKLPEKELVNFTDGNFGAQQFLTNTHFGDFILWRHDDVPSYQLAVVVDDHDMRITEVVRGADLLKCTARQILLYRAMGWKIPEFYHCPLVTDTHGQRLAKRNNALSIRHIRESGETAESIIDKFAI